LARFGGPGHRVRRRGEWLLNASKSKRPGAGMKARSVNILYCTRLRMDRDCSRLRVNSPARVPNSNHNPRFSREGAKTLRSDGLLTTDPEK
jgi:hypothetical protein